MWVGWYLKRGVALACCSQILNFCKSPDSSQKGEVPLCEKQGATKCYRVVQGGTGSFSVEEKGEACVPISLLSPCCKKATWSSGKTKVQWKAWRCSDIHFSATQWRDISKRAVCSILFQFKAVLCSSTKPSSSSLIANIATLRSSLPWLHLYLFQRPPYISPEIFSLSFLNNRPDHKLEQML